MDYHSQTFFVHKMDKSPVVHVLDTPEDKRFPVSIRINEDEKARYSDPSITIHFTSMSQYIKFKNSVIQAHEAMIRRQKRPV